MLKRIGCVHNEALECRVSIVCVEHVWRVLYGGKVLKFLNFLQTFFEKKILTPPHFYAKMR
jgi:hypothetical protein